MTTIETFPQELEAFKQANAGVIQELVQGAMRLQREQFDDLHWELVDELKGLLGGNAANDEVHEPGQERAISDAERWVAENISGEGVEMTIVLALFLRGLEKGENLIKYEIARVRSRAIR